jgi:hypothetical protein
VRWSPRRWGYAVAASLVIQLALLFYLGERPKRPPPRERFGASIDLAADPWAAEQLGQLPTLRDPALFALPSRQGFSGRAWLTFAALEHRAAEWAELPAWLELETPQLMRAFYEQVATNTPGPLLVADKPLPRLGWAGTPVPAVPLRDRSECQTEGGLAGRPFLTPLELPSWQYSGATLLPPGSGLSEADHYAVQTAAGARYRPAPRSAREDRSPSLAWGTLVFRWDTIPAGTTNAAGEGR